MHYEESMKQARGLEKAPLVFKHANLINVYQGVIETVDIAVKDGVILGIGSYSGITEIDLKNRYVAPGFIDSHVHIESSMLTPLGFSKLVLPKGTTTIIADPHEIANVLGLKGINFMLEASENLDLDVFFMVPSSVPATSFEHSGSSLNALEIASLKNHPRILGLGEVMDYPAVLSGESDVHQKIDIMDHKMVDGHAPDLQGNDLNAYIYSGIMTDHESTTPAMLEERIKRGMYVHLREGSATRNVTTLLKGVTPKNRDRITFCTDDKHSLDIINEGHINYNVNLAISYGMDPIDAIKIATLNAATCYQLKDRGGLAPGKIADFIVFDSLSKIEPLAVYKRGLCVARNGSYIHQKEEVIPDDVSHTIHITKNSPSFDLNVKSNPVRVIELIAHNILTGEAHLHVQTKDGLYQDDPNQDCLKIVSIERHRGLNCTGIGLVKGFGFKHSALGMSISHDSHNIVIVGSNDADMRCVLDQIHHMQGGIALASHQEIIESIPLEVAGLMTAASGYDVAGKLKQIRKKLMDMGLKMEDDPLIALSFLCLPVIPKLKLTDQGLFDVESFSFVNLEV